MKHYSVFCLLAVACLFISCATENSSAVDKSKWAKYKIDNNWVFSAPEGAKILYFKGIDSIPGKIVLQNDSVSLEFDSTFEGSSDTVCNLNNELVRAKAHIARGDYKFLDKIDTLHTIQVDTVNGMAATIITPKRIGVGVTDIFISNCEYHCGLGIYANNLPLSKQELLLEIFRSIQCKASK
jgi:hypothetical protein